MVVVRQRAEPGEDLVEEILRVDLLHDLPVDAVTDLEHPLPVHEPDGLGQRGGNAREEPPVIAAESRLRPHECHRAPCGTPPPDGSHHHVPSCRRMCMTNEPGDVVQIPAAPARNGQQQLSCRLTVFGHGDAAVGRLEERPALPERISQGLARLADRAQVLRQVVEELEGFEFPGWCQHESRSGRC